MVLAQSYWPPVLAEKSRSRLFPLLKGTHPPHLSLPSGFTSAFFKGGKPPWCRTENDEKAAPVKLLLLWTHCRPPAPL